MHGSLWCASTAVVLAAEAAILSKVTGFRITCTCTSIWTCMSSAISWISRFTISTIIPKHTAVCEGVPRSAGWIWLKSGQFQWDILYEEYHLLRYGLCPSWDTCATDFLVLVVGCQASRFFQCFEQGKFSEYRLAKCSKDHPVNQMYVPVWKSQTAIWCCSAWAAESLFASLLFGKLHQNVNKWHHTSAIMSALYSCYSDAGY